MAEPVDVLGLTCDELGARAQSRMRRGAGVWVQVYRDAVRRGVWDPAGHGLNDESVAEWNRCFRLRLPEVVRVVEEDRDGRATEKAVLRLDDGLEVECVRIPMAHGNSTLCISSQVGCKMGCTFCETGLMGLLRNLTAAEIVSQVVVANAVLGWDIKNVVYMGMGEALDNVDCVIQSLRVLNDRKGLLIGQQRITVCTVGHIPGIERLSRLGWPRLNLALSLSAGDDETRSQIMPITRKMPVADVLAAVQRYWPRKNFVLALNYCLIPGVNDRRQDASSTAALATGVGRALINLIPYNPGTRPIARAPTEEETARFIGWLEEDGAMVRRRKTKGRGAMAACGQLGNPTLRRPRSS